VIDHLKKRLFYLLYPSLHKSCIIHCMQKFNFCIFFLILSLKPHSANACFKVFLPCLNNLHSAWESIFSDIRIKFVNKKVKDGYKSNIINKINKKLEELTLEELNQDTLFELAKRKKQEVNEEFEFQDAFFSKILRPELIFRSSSAVPNRPVEIPTATKVPSQQNGSEVLVVEEINPFANQIPDQIANQISSEILKTQIFVLDKTKICVNSKPTNGFSTRPWYPDLDLILQDIYGNTDNRDAFKKIVCGSQDTMLSNPLFSEQRLMEYDNEILYFKFSKDLNKLSNDTNFKSKIDLLKKNFKLKLYYEYAISHEQKKITEAESNVNILNHQIFLLQGLISFLQNPRSLNYSSFEEFKKNSFNLLGLALDEWAFIKSMWKKH